MQQSSRLQTLELEDRPYEATRTRVGTRTLGLPESLLSLIPALASQLTSLEVRSCGLSAPVDADKLASALASKPCLKHLRLLSTSEELQTTALLARSPLSADSAPCESRLANASTLHGSTRSGPVRCRSLRLSTFTALLRSTARVLCWSLWRTRSRISRLRESALKSLATTASKSVATKRTKQSRLLSFRKLFYKRMAPFNFGVFSPGCMPVLRELVLGCAWTIAETRTILQCVGSELATVKLRSRSPGRHHVSVADARALFSELDRTKVNVADQEDR